MQTTKTKRIGNRSDIVEALQELLDRKELAEDIRARLQAVLDAIEKGI